MANEKKPPTNVLNLIAKHLINKQKRKPPPPLIPGASLGAKIRMRKKGK